MELDFQIDIIGITMNILVWCLIGYFAYRIRKKQMVGIPVWKIGIVVLVGLFSFSININLFDTPVRLPILPLGVWILYLFKGDVERWQKYRLFAWLGFWANFLFLLMTFISIPIHHGFYPKSDPATYIGNVEKAFIINIHPSGEERVLNKEILLNQLSQLKEDTVYSEKWYEETYMNADLNEGKERFPYQVIGVSSKWGSGLQPSIYLEEDGKGILILTSSDQYYFRSEDSMLLRKGE
ncbi:hypothetical protein ABE096_23440 [Robertmurraya massiliosenegalensis]|uniref:hypothetical protein n=1 Tax=Robertmurraya TaxID=2837507 RepID=UPI0039A457F3